MFLPVLVTVLAGYLLGNLNGAVSMSVLLSNEDVRTKGSGNAGLTNFIRNFGAANAILVVLIDAGKAVVACLVGGLLLQSQGFYREGVVLGGTAVMLGHVFPALLGFRGGKGILSGAVIAFMADWRIGLIVLGVFALAYLFSGYVSLGSVLASVAFGVCFIVFWHGDIQVMLGGSFMAALAVYMHRSNIRRLLKGTESKTNLFGKGKAS